MSDRAARRRRGSNPLTSLATRTGQIQGASDRKTQKMPMRTRRSLQATRLVRQHRLDGSPPIVGEFIAHDSTCLVLVSTRQARYEPSYGDTRPGGTLQGDVSGPLSPNSVLRFTV